MQKQKKCIIKLPKKIKKNPILKKENTNKRIISIIMDKNALKNLTISIFNIIMF